MSLTRLSNGNERGNSASGLCNGANVLCAKPFAPKGVAGPLMPTVSSDMLKQKLATMNAKPVPSTSIKPEKSAPVEPPSFKPVVAPKASVPKKPVRHVEATMISDLKREDNNYQNQEQSDDKNSPDMLRRPKSGSVKECMSIFETKDRAQRPQVMEKFKPNRSLKQHHGRDNLSHPAHDAKDISSTMEGNIEKPRQPNRPQRSIKSPKPPVACPGEAATPVVERDKEVLKPTSIQLPVYPEGLDAWIRQYVLTNDRLTPLANTSKLSMIIKTQATSSQSSIDTQSSVDHVQQDDIYDDVNQVDKTEDDIYDDAANITTDNDAAIDQPIYEIQDGEEECNNEQNSSEHHDQLSKVDTTDNAADPGPMLYEAIELMEEPQTPTGVTQNEATEDQIKDKKKEKERREQEKRDKKEKERLEKEKRREEEEKKRKEKEERKRKAKERKAFGLKADNVLPVLGRHFPPRDYKGKDKDLTYTTSDCIEIVSKSNCPKGKWLAQNSDKKLGYILLKEFGIEQDEDATSPKIPDRIPTEDELPLEEEGELYEEINAPGDAPAPALPPLRGAVVTSPPIVQEDMYDDVGVIHDGDGEEEEENLYQAI